VVEQPNLPGESTAPQGDATRRVRCQALLGDGSPCQAHHDFVDPATGFCFSHDPARREELRAAAVRGGRRTAQRYGRGIHPDELPPLTSPAAAQEWVAIVAVAVASGRISSAAGNSIRQLLEQYLRAGEVIATRRRVMELEGQLRRSTVRRA
jgi:hypothetical protein